jgi:5-methylcytosine-specific restriction endonuclease McrA
MTWTPEYKAAYQRRWRTLHPGYNAAHCKASYHKDREKGQWASKRSFYGIDKVAWTAQFVSQNRRCATCNTDHPTVKGTGYWTIHHLHHLPKPWKFVILCQKCNRASGLFKDDPALLRKMADINEALATMV